MDRIILQKGLRNYYFFSMSPKIKNQKISERREKSNFTFGLYSTETGLSEIVVVDQLCHCLAHYYYAALWKGNDVTFRVWTSDMHGVLSRSKQHECYMEVVTIIC